MCLLVIYMNKYVKLTFVIMLKHLLKDNLWFITTWILLSYEQHKLVQRQLGQRQHFYNKI